ncbi:hypothetical protein KVJ73_06075 [Helicobacter pylori]|nr:hypothetical protein KVJ73_06075 [Helicobacter pylori]
MTDEEKIKTEQIKTEREFYFKINSVRYDFTKQRCTTLIQVLVVVFGFTPFVIDKMNIMPILKTFVTNPIDCFRLVPWNYEVSVFMVSFCLVIYVFSVICALFSAYYCLIIHEVYFDNQAKTIEYDIRILQSNTDREREGIKKEKQEHEIQTKRPRKNYEKAVRGPLASLVYIIISAMLCVECSMFYNFDVFDYKNTKKMDNNQNSSMECFGFQVAKENLKPKTALKNKAF